MRVIRSHLEGKSEIDLMANKVRSFVAFRRNQIVIQAYVTAVVAVGRRNIIKDELRENSNECLMPILDLLDKFQSRNEFLGTY